MQEANAFSSRIRVHAASSTNDYDPRTTRALALFLLNSNVHAPAARL
jgi:hypothetical protein